MKNVDRYDKVLVENQICRVDNVAWLRSLINELGTYVNTILNYSRGFVFTITNNKAGNLSDQLTQCS